MPDPPAWPDRFASRGVAGSTSVPPLLWPLTARHELRNYKFWHHVAGSAFNLSGPWECWPTKPIPPGAATGRRDVSSGDETCPSPEPRARTTTNHAPRTRKTAAAGFRGRRIEPRSTRAAKPCPPKAKRAHALLRQLPRSKPPPRAPGWASAVCSPPPMRSVSVAGAASGGCRGEQGGYIVSTRAVFGRARCLKLPKCYRQLTAFVL